MIRLRSGLNGQEDSQSLAAIGRRLGITPERVRKLETEALEHLASRRELGDLREAA